VTKKLKKTSNNINSQPGRGALWPKQPGIEEGKTNKFVHDSEQMSGRSRPSSKKSGKEHAMRSRKVD